MGYDKINSLIRIDNWRLLTKSFFIKERVVGSIKKSKSIFRCNHDI